MRFNRKSRNHGNELHLATPVMAIADWMFASSSCIAKLVQISGRANIGPSRYREAACLAAAVARFVESEV